LRSGVIVRRVEERAVQERIDPFHETALATMDRERPRRLHPQNKMRAEYDRTDRPSTLDTADTPGAGHVHD
jgi:hypothetical protein